MAAAMVKFCCLPAVNVLIKRKLGLQTLQKWQFRGNQSSSDLLYSLLKRGLLKQIFPSQLTNFPGVPCAYAGFDATADSLHIGNLLIVIALLHWQRAGYNTIAVVGDATAKIGDPSGQKNDRKVLSPEAIEQNANSIELDLLNIFQNHEEYIFPKTKHKNQKLGSLSILKNSEWYNSMNIVDFISKAGRNIRVGEMLSRTSVKARMDSGTGINFSEFSYQIFQSYDWLHLFKTHNCRFQFGGNDQLGNITSGYNLISGLMYQQVYGALLPLIQSETGDKFGKSAGNAVFLSSQHTSAFDLYQFFMRLPDSNVRQYLTLFTFLSMDDIEAVVQSHMKSPDLRKAQKRIAEEVTLLVHGEKGLYIAESATNILFRSDLKSLCHLKVEDLEKVFPSSTITNLVYEPGISLKEITMKSGCFLKEEDAERIIQGGGVYLNFEKITSPELLLVPELHILPNRISLLRIGKKTYYIVVWK